MEPILDYWPVISTLVAGGVAVGAWMFKVYSMLSTCVSGIEQNQKNLATHEHDQSGKVVIPAR
tara:strand:+ start:13538 stop:13726 length:189 start_codon:yes stop_codon:yes gene_type:complete